MADAALAALRAAACECAATARRFSPEQSAEAAALSNVLHALFSRSTAAATAELIVQRRAPLLPQLPTELIVEVLQHLDVRSLGRLACTCRHLSFGPPCPPRPMSLVEAAIRRRADAVGRWTPLVLPAGVSKWVPFLLQREWRNGMEFYTVATGCGRSFFVDVNGRLLACGKEKEPGLLGLRGGASQTPFEAAVLTPVPSMTRFRIRTVICHDHCNLAVSEAGQVFAWGQSGGWVQEWRSVEYAPEPTPVLSLQSHRVRQVAAGYLHCASVTEDGALFTWETHRLVDVEADNPVPALGYGSFVHDFGVPQRVFALEGVRIASVAVGNMFTVAVTEAGAVYSFGLRGGSLGHGEFDEERSVYLPKHIEALDGIPVSTVAAGDSHALALTRCGRVYSWGAKDRDSMLVHGRGNNAGGNGDGLAEDDICIPRLITALLGERVRAIAAGPEVSCAVTDAGALYTWGEYDWCCLGHGADHGESRPKLVTALHGIHVVGVSMHMQLTSALATDGSVYSFGRGPGLNIGREGEGEDEGTIFAPRRIPPP
jgi:alpha-tubulin suppressor-like RCC1 family protein